MLDPFKQKHSNLNEISISYCTFGAEVAYQLSLALGSFNNKSLKKITLSYNQIGEGQMNNVITAIGMQTELETLVLRGMDIGRNECVEPDLVSVNFCTSANLSIMIRWSTKKLQRLNLCENNIDDESVQSLVSAICGSKLILLSLSRNQLITL